MPAASSRARPRTAQDLNSPVLEIPLIDAPYRGPYLQVWHGEDWTNMMDDDNEGATEFSYTVSYYQREKPHIAVGSIAAKQVVVLAITRSMIRAAQEDSTPAQLSFAVVQVSHARFELLGSPATRFTQEDIDSGRVALANDNGTVAPSFVLSVSDGHLNATTGTVTVSYTLANYPPVVTANAISATEGAVTVLDGSMIASSDTENDSVTFTVVAASHCFFALASSRDVPIVTFGQSDIDGGRVVLLNDGLKTTPAYTLSASDGKEETLAVGTVHYTLASMPPHVVANHFAVTEGSAVVLDSSMLAAADIDNTSDQLAFAVRHCYNGWFARSPALREPIMGFTQRDVERGGVAFVHPRVGAGVPACSLVVSDGTTTTALSVSSVRLNRIPTVALDLAGQPSCCYAVQGSGYAFAFSPATFADADNDTLAFTATLPDGAPLPSWLTFNGTTRTLAGVPPAAGPLEVRVAAADGMGATAAATMRLLEPPTIDVALVGSSLAVAVRLPQMVPHRTGVSAEFVDPETREGTGLAVAMPENPCHFGAVTRAGVWDLIRTARPSVRGDAAHYALRFAVRVRWAESAPLGTRRLNRTMESTVAFEVRIRRTLSVSSFVQTLDAGLLWSYVSKASAVPVRDHDGAVTQVLVDIEMATSAVEEGFAIDPHSFVVDTTTRDACRSGA
eukprot:m51a1_g13208 hypothetical protein (676) ;mRNA; f:196-2429